VRVELSVDGTATTSVVADTIDRPDVLRTFPFVSGRRGYWARAMLESGDRLLCTKARNVTGTPGADRDLGCTWLELSPTPFGSVDDLVTDGSPSPTSARLRGWVIDPDRAEPVAVHVYRHAARNGVVGPPVAGPFTASADGFRGDVAAAFPTYGAARGFDVDVPLPGTSWGWILCAYGQDAVSGTDFDLLGCRSTGPIAVP
jgi:hypothetical protein